jgi:pyochelin biosynthesis protein PchG
VHAGELSEILRVVADTGTHYMLNSHHVHVAGVRRFVGAARELLRRQPPAFVDVATSVQVLYTVLDILGVTLDRLRPWGFARPADLPDAVRRRLGRDIPFRSLDGMLGGIPATLRVQHQMDPRQPDNHAHLWHRITLGTDGGTLTLIGGNGPVLWCPRSHLPPNAAGLAGFDELTADHIDYPSAEPIGAADAPSFADVLRHTWPQAVATAVARLWSAVCDKADPLRDGQYHLMLGRLSADVLDLLGPLELVSRSTPRVLAAADLTPAAVAAEAASIGKVPT